MLSNPGSVPYTSEIDSILAPAKDILKQLLINPDKMGPRRIPAKAWIRKQRKSLTKAIVPFAASLTITERAMVANWFENVVCEGDQTVRRHWLGLLPIAHAHTVFLAHRLQEENPSIKRKANELLDIAWALQCSGTTKDLILDVDVDKECLERLEELMFERSERAGIAGNRQWGLDVGDHQDAWDVYAGLPEHWNHEDRAESERETEVTRPLRSSETSY